MTNNENKTATTMLVLINRHSRRGNDPGVSSVFEVLRNGGVKLIEYYPDPPDRFRGLIEKHYGEIDAIIIGGGDGTLRLVAESLIKYGLPVGILPLGTANDLARTLGIPSNIEEAARIILKRNAKPVNLGVVNRNYFFNVANIGLGVKIARRMSGQVKRKLGILGYVASFFEVFRRQRSFRVVIECEGDRRLQLKSIQVAVGNGRYYGGGVAISEDADIRRNGLVLYSLEPKSLWELVVMGPLFRSGKIKEVNGVTLMRSVKFRVTTDRPMHVSADGEIVSATPADFGFLPGAVNIYLPET